jgi:hypothetical protein
VSRPALARLRRTSVVLLVTTAVLVPLTGQRAAAGSSAPRSGKQVSSTPADTPGVPAWVWDEQAVLDAAADRIDPVLKADPNYTGVFVDARDRRLVGYATKPFGAALWAHARALMPAGTTLDYGRAMLSDRDVQDLTRYTSQRQRAGLQAAVWGLSSLDGPFEVSLQPGHALPASDEAYLHRHGKDTLRVAHQAVSPAGRFDDTAPFYGGSYINGPLGTTEGKNYYESCTSGFMTRSNTNGSNYIITAAHCIKWADSREWTGSPTTAFLGNATAQDPGTDAAYVKVASAVSPTMYDGTYGNDYDIKPVVGAVANHVGDDACGSGATSRRNCTWQIGTMANVTSVNGYTGATYQSVEWSAHNVSGGESVGQGDSGGPVFSYVNSNTQVQARGIIDAGSSTTSCPYWVAYGTVCYKTVYFGDVNSMIKNRSLDITP